LRELAALGEIGLIVLRMERGLRIDHRPVGAARQAESKQQGVDRLSRLQVVAVIMLRAVIRREDRKCMHLHG
jgi:hypothetical protein